jgi:hypothetical protein
VGLVGEFVESWYPRTPRQVDEIRAPPDDVWGSGEEMDRRLGGACGKLSGPQAQAATRAKNISNREHWERESSMPKETPPRLSLKIAPRVAGPGRSRRAPRRGSGL